jgi:cytochrome c5
LLKSSTQISLIVVARRHLLKWDCRSVHFRARIALMITRGLIMRGRGFLLVACVVIFGSEALGQGDGAGYAQLGAKVFEATCKSCHAVGSDSNGAPQLRDTAAWKERLVSGKETLYSNSINGYQGYFTMPAKGGNAALSDEEVKAAVDYLLDQAGLR